MVADRFGYRLDLSKLSDCLTSRTKLVAITAISNVLGTINSVREIADAAHRVGSLVLVDAAQAVPHGPLSVEQLAADFLVFSGHKMLGAKRHWRPLWAKVFARVDAADDGRRWHDRSSHLRRIYARRFTQSL